MTLAVPIAGLLCKESSALNGACLKATSLQSPKTALGTHWPNVRFPPNLGHSWRRRRALKRSVRYWGELSD